MQLHQHREELEEEGVQIAGVSFETVASANEYLKDTRLEWPIFLDEQKTLYHHFGMGEAGFWDIWGYRTWRAYLRELAQGRRPRKGAGDIHQRGGDVLVDPSGVIRLHHIGKGPGDRPAVEYLLQFIRSGAGDDPSNSSSG